MLNHFSPTTMRILQRWLCLLLLSLSLLPDALAQKSERTRFFEFGPSIIMASKIQDLATSPLLYQGGGLGIDLALNRHRHLQGSHRITQLYNQWRFSLLQPQSGRDNTDARLQSIFTRLGGSHMRSIIANDRSRWYGGLNLQFSGHLQINDAFVNSAYAYQANMSLGLTSRLERDFRWAERGWWIFKKSRQITAFGQVTAPMIGRGTTTYYATPLGPRIIDLHTTSPGNYAEVYTDVGLQFHIRNGNRFGLAYQWQYQSADIYNRVRVAAHQLRIFLDFNY